MTQGTMIHALPFSNWRTEPAFESSVGAVHAHGKTLTCEVDINQHETVAVSFDDYWAFRYMEEGDLGYYLESGQFDDNYLIYEIREGGWKSGECGDRHLMAIASAFENYHE